MQREIKKANQTLSNNSNQVESNDYKNRLIKLIPAEVVTGYITLYGIITSQQNNQQLLLTIIFFSLLIFTPLYLFKISKVENPVQLIFSSIAFVIWVMATGGFKILLPDVTIFKNEILGSILLIIYTLAIPFVFKGK